MESNIASMNILLYVTAFILGYIIGRITGKSDIRDHRIDAKGSFFKPESRQRKQVEIDEKKFVTSVSTDSLQRKGKELGTQTIVEDDLATSASKLAMLKKNK
jgi:hypothetical protein